MDAKLRQVSQLLKRYDSDLFPKRFLDGALAIMRRRRDFDFYRMNDCVLWFARDYDDVVLPCTDTWIHTGQPVDWGIEPILSQIQKLDGWRDDTDYERFAKNRERLMAAKKQSQRNEIKAIAYDLRRDFAKATNDINTSTLN